MKWSCDYALVFISWSVGFMVEQCSMCCSSTLYERFLVTLFRSQAKEPVSDKDVEKCIYVDWLQGCAAASEWKICIASRVAEVDHWRADRCSPMQVFLLVQTCRGAVSVRKLIHYWVRLPWNSSCWHIVAKCFVRNVILSSPCVKSKTNFLSPSIIPQWITANLSNALVRREEQPNLYIQCHCKNSSLWNSISAILKHNRRDKNLVVIWQGK